MTQLQIFVKVCRAGAHANTREARVLPIS